MWNERRSEGRSADGATRCECPVGGTIETGHTPGQTAGHEPELAEETRNVVQLVLRLRPVERAAPAAPHPGEAYGTRPHPVSLPPGRSRAQHQVGHRWRARDDAHPHAPQAVRGRHREDLLAGRLWTRRCNRGGPIGLGGRQVLDRDCQARSSSCRLRGSGTGGGGMECNTTIVARPRRARQAHGWHGQGLSNVRSKRGGARRSPPMVIGAACSRASSEARERWSGVELPAPKVAASPSRRPYAPAPRPPCGPAPGADDFAGCRSAATVLQ